MQADGGDEAIRLDAALSDVDWTSVPLGTVPSWFRAPSGELATWSLGDPGHPRVVLLPGVTGSKEDFILLAPLLAAGGYYVQSYDLAGQYESASAGPPAGAHYDYHLFAADLEAFLRAGGPAHVLGYSFAGILAQIVVARHPELCRSLTLMTTPPQPGQVFRGVRWIGWLSWLLSARQCAGLMIWGIVTNKNRIPPLRLAFVRSRFGLTRRSSVDDIIGIMKRAPDVRRELAAIAIPKLVAVGNHDLWPPQLHAQFAEEIGGALAVYRTGHSPCETAPHQLARDMLVLFASAGP
ncbi:MAG: hypothetical protein QOF36_1341 [Microbacteriaceae bacterium]|nr:hypothetical protein [Microbacteriaceae bacterium]